MDEAHSYHIGQRLKKFAFSKPLTLLWFSTQPKTEDFDGIHEGKHHRHDLRKDRAPQKDSTDVVELLFDTMKTPSSGGEPQDLRFRVVQRPQQEVTTRSQPPDGQAMEITARKVVTFKPSQVLRDALNTD